VAALHLKKRTRFFPCAKVGVDTDRTPDGQRVIFATLALEVPLFDQGQPALARLAAELAQARDNYAAREVNVRSEVREARDVLLTARDAVEFSEKNLLPLRKKILGQTLLHYNAMQKNSYDLLVAKEREQMAEQTYVESKRDYWIARVELERAVGGRVNQKSVNESNPNPERSKP
jgi:cobalt-zinc-cadmium efflux system outer membrane protein